MNHVQKNPNIQIILGDKHPRWREELVTSTQRYKLQIIDQYGLDSKRTLQMTSYVRWMKVRMKIEQNYISIK